MLGHVPHPVREIARYFLNDARTTIRITAYTNAATATPAAMRSVQTSAMSWVMTRPRTSR